MHVVCLCGDCDPAATGRRRKAACAQRYARPVRAAMTARGRRHNADRRYARAQPADSASACASPTVLRKMPASSLQDLHELRSL